MTTPPVGDSRGTAAETRGRGPGRETTSGTVLYDAPGPRTRRVTLIVSVVSAVAIVGGAYLFIVRPLANNGQFSMKKWGPIVDPDNPTFSLLWDRLGYGIRNTLIAAVFAIITSLIVGTVLATLRIQLHALRQRSYVGLPPTAAFTARALTWLLNAVTRFCVEVFRGMPVVITIFFVARGFPEFGLNLDNPLWYVVIGLTIYNGVVIGEILRSGMSGLPAGQSEAASAIGLTPFQTTRLVLLPQAYRIMLPALISQLVVVLKDTSLGFIAAYEEVLRVANQAIQILDNPIQLYFVVGVMFIVVNYSLSKVAEYIQHRLARGRRGLAPPTAAPGTELETEAVVGTTT